MAKSSYSERKLKSKFSQSKREFNSSLSRSRRISYAAIPPAVATKADTLEIGLECMDAVVNYVAYRAKAKDSQYANAAEAASFYQVFSDALGVQTQMQNAASPNQPGHSV